MEISPLLNKLVTRQDADDLVMYLDDLRDSLTRKEVLPSSWQEALLAVYKANNIDTQNKVQISDFLVKVREHIKKIPTVNLTLAVDLSSQSLEEISNTLTEHVGEKVLLELRKDEAIVAGAVIAYNGYFKDYSLRGKLDEVITQQDK